jgi:drug/metabolite transporter superfamily protein YnfA
LTIYRLYWGFVLLTPLLFILIYIGKRRYLKLRALPQNIKQWPWWKLIASTVAFIFWAWAVPPVVTTDAGKVVAAFGAVFVSTILSILGAVFEPPEA